MFLPTLPSEGQVTSLQRQVLVFLFLRQKSEALTRVITHAIKMLHKPVGGREGGKGGSRWEKVEEGGRWKVEEGVREGVEKVEKVGEEMGSAFCPLQFLHKKSR